MGSIRSAAVVHLGKLQLGRYHRVAVVDKGDGSVDKSMGGRTPTIVFYPQVRYIVFELVKYHSPTGQAKN